MQNQQFDTFIDQLAAMLLGKHAHELDKIAVVFPNRRASVFLRKAIARQSQSYTWSPVIFSTQDFVKDRSELEIADPQDLLFELYEAYHQKFGEQADEFDQFIQWGGSLVHDFNEIDLYVEKPAALFSYLSEAKAIELWAENMGELSAMQKQYLHFWNTLSQLYFDFRALLLSKAKAYPGMAYRKLAEMHAVDLMKGEQQHIYFAGFNALNKAEEQFMKKLCKENLAEMIWDADAYYFDNPMHEAGLFLRNIKNSWKDITSIIPEQQLQQRKRAVHAVGQAKHMAQVQTAGKIVSKLINEGKPISDIALVLADESLLPAQLEHLPPEVKAVNITMGFPLHASAASVLLRSILRFIIDSNRLSNRLQSKDLLCYSHQLKKLLTHTLCRQWIGTGKLNLSIEAFLAKIQAEKTIYVNATSVAGLFAAEEAFQAFGELFEPISAHDGKTMIERMLHFFNQLLKTLHEHPQADHLETESVFGVKKVLQISKLYFDKYERSIGIMAMEQWINQQLKGGNIPFYGEPLEGLQIMGMLETRCLDFKYIVMVSVNEEILPKGKSNNSFIPLDIRKKFGLPVFNDSDAVFSYHFYRLMQRCDEAFLIYNTEPDELGKGEASRFVLQLFQEMKDFNTVLYKHLAPSDELIADKEQVITIPKDIASIERIESLADYGISPSAINTFQACSLRYYFKYILNVKTNDEADEQVGMDELGTAVHNALEHIYKPFISKHLNVKKLETSRDELQTLIHKELSQAIGGKRIDFGRNKLYAIVAERLASNFLKFEAEELGKNETTLIGLETELKAVLTLPKSNHTITLKGKADRIDRRGDVIRIIDYKTGSVKEKSLKLDTSIELNDQKNDLPKVIQLLCYAYIYLKANKDVNAVQPAIFGLRQRNYTMPLLFNDSLIISREELPLIEQLLQDLLEPLFDFNIPFYQTDDHEQCKYCDFIAVCNRMA
jgi:hypothetical protein